MNLDAINKKRKSITRLSVIITTIIIAISAVCLILGMFSLLFYVIA
jgi:hypothetical protein